MSSSADDLAGFGLHLAVEQQHVDLVQQLVDVVGLGNQRLEVESDLACHAIGGGFPLRVGNHFAQAHDVDRGGAHEAVQVVGIAGHAAFIQDLHLGGYPVGVCDGRACRGIARAVEVEHRGRTHGGLAFSEPLMPSPRLMVAWRSSTLSTTPFTVLPRPWAVT